MLIIIGQHNMTANGTCSFKSRCLPGIDSTLRLLPNVYARGSSAAVAKMNNWTGKKVVRSKQGVSIVSASTSPSITSCDLRFVSRYILSTSEAVEMTLTSKKKKNKITLSPSFHWYLCKELFSGKKIYASSRRSSWSLSRLFSRVQTLFYANC